MMRRLQPIVFFLVLLFVSGYARAQAVWSGIIDPSRAVNWANAGVPGGIPSGSWTECGPTIAAGTPASSINSTISGCPANTFVLLGPGTFNLTAGLTLKSNVALRGSGANSTFLVFTGDSNNCGGLNAAIGICGSNNSAGGEQNICNWSSGYAAGTTSITLSASCPTGSGSNLKVGTILILDQIDVASDNGWIWQCLVTNSCSNGGSGGAARTDGGSVGGTSNRSQQQVVEVTAVSGSGPYTVTISPAIRMPNWTSTQLPQAWFATAPIANAGVENLSIDNSNGTSGTRSILLFNSYGSWVSGVRSLVAGRAHVGLEIALHSTIQSNYFYQSQSHASQSYGVENFTDGDDLIVNNISQQNTEPFPNNGGGDGNVHAYNYAIYDLYTQSPGWFQPCINDHASGNDNNLAEGNICAGYQADNVHGNHYFLTTFRNRFPGWQTSCDGSACSAQTVPVQIYASSRFFNVIGNVLGQTGIHNNYTCAATSGSGCPDGNTSIYTLGFTGNGGSVDGSIDGFAADCGEAGGNDYDKCTTTGLFRWGNFDIVNASNRFNSDEVPSGLSLYANAVPSSQALPRSFVYSSAPSWWQNEPWPPIGPDVSGGNLGRCSGGSYSGALATNSNQCTGGSLVTDAAGEANSIPAMDCYLNKMGGPADGSGSALSFNAGSCYPSAEQNSPVPPSGLTAVVN